MLRGSSRDDVLDRALSAVGEGRSVVFLGEMGIGKSHLLQRLVARLRADDHVVTTVRASAASQTIPFGALTAFVPGGDEIDRLAMLRAAVETLVALPQGRPHVIAVDDAPLLDEQSLAVLDRLAADHRVPVLSTVRSTDPRPAALETLWRSTDAEVIDVGPLSGDEAAAVVAELLPSDADTNSEAVGRIVERGAGNPLFLGELVRAVDDDDGLTPKLRELVASRIGALDEPLRTHLAMVAAADPLDVRLDAVDLEAIAALERRSLVVTIEEPDGLSARPAHPLFGEVVRAGLGAAERIGLVRSVAASLQRLDDGLHRRGDALRLATWLLEAAERPDASLAAVAAREALWWHDVDRARLLATIAVEDDPSIDHLYMAGEVSRLTGHIDDSLRWWNDALEEALTDHDLGRLAMAISQVHAWFRNEPDLAVGVLNRTAERMQDPLNRLECWSEAALFASLLGRYDDVVDAAQQVLEHPRASDDARWTALSNVTWAEAQLVRLDSCDDRFELVAELRGQLGPERAGEVDLLDAVIVSTRLEQGRLADGHDHVAQVDAANRPVGTTLFSHAQIHLVEGDTEGAIAAATRSVAELAAYDPFNASPLAASVAAICLAAAGRPYEARCVLHEAQGSTIDADGVWESIWFARADAWIAHARGDAETAAGACRRSIERAQQTGHDGWAQMALVDAITLEAIETDDPIVRHARERLPTQTGAPYVAALTDGVIALHDRDVDAVDDAAGRLGKLDARWPHAALLAAGAKLTDDVDAHRRATIARTLVSQSLLLPRTPGRGLSDRQLEIARATTSGVTSREIAEQLFLSVRTVDNHLRAAYRVLGISTRAELAELLAHPSP